MTPQLQTSAFLPSYFSPCAAMTQRFKRLLTSKWINYPWRTREGRMGNPTFQFSHLLPKVAFPTRRPRHSPVIAFLWTTVYSLICDLWEQAQKWGAGKEWSTTHKWLELALNQCQRCIKDIKNVFFSSLALQGAFHQSHYLWTHNIVWTVSSVRFLLGFTLKTCFKRGEPWPLKSWILVFRGQWESRGKG